MKFKVLVGTLDYGSHVCKLALIVVILAAVCSSNAPHDAIAQTGGTVVHNYNKVFAGPKGELLIGDESGPKYGVTANGLVPIKEKNTKHKKGKKQSTKSTTSSMQPQ